MQIGVGGGLPGGAIRLLGLSGCDVPLHSGQVRALNDGRGPIGSGNKGGRDTTGQTVGAGGGQGGQKAPPPDPPLGYVSDIRRCPTGGGAQIRLHGDFPVGVRLVSVMVGGKEAK